MQYCPTDVMWADVLTKSLQGQKFRDMHAFLQNCPRNYDDDIELQTDKLAWKSMKQQAKTVASLQECVGEKRACKTRACAVSHGQIRHRMCLVNRQDRGLSCVL